MLAVSDGRRVLTHVDQRHLSIDLFRVLN